MLILIPVLFALVTTMGVAPAIAAGAIAPSVLAIPVLASSTYDSSPLKATSEPQLAPSKTRESSVLKLTPAEVAKEDLGALLAKAKLMSTTLRIAEKCGLATADLDSAAEALGAEVARDAEQLRVDRLLVGNAVLEAAAAVDRDFPSTPPAEVCEKAVRGLENSL